MDNQIHGKLDNAQQTIRVATILPHLFALGGKIRLTLNEVSLRTDPDFDVLSYSVEGVPPLRSLSVDGKSISITADLYAALRQMRTLSKSRPQRIWIHKSEAMNDAREVENLREVYQHARNVLTWAKKDDSKMSAHEITASMLFASPKGTGSPLNGMKKLEDHLPTVQASSRPLSATQAPSIPQASGRRFRDMFRKAPLYSRLDRKKCQIRLATILPCSDLTSPVQLSLETVSLDDKIDFEALSYCWGDSGIEQEIIIDNFPLKVTSNLHAALLAFQIHARGQRVRLWIDAICINQQDTPEREWQVTLMGEIYTRARNVRTWLGRDDTSASDLTAQAFDRLRKLISGQGATPASLEDVLTDVELLHLFQNPYWHRRWITQELVLAQRLSIYRGSSFEPNVDLRALYKTLHHIATELQMEVPYHGDRELWNAVNSDKNARKVHQPCQEILNAIAPVTAFDKPLIQHPYLLRDIRGAQQKKDHDCVYGILGLLKRDLGHALVEPDYDLPIEKVFVDFAYKFMRASKSLAFLYEAYPEDPRLPTWVPDLRVTSRDNSRFIPDEVQLDVNPDSCMTNATFRTGIRFPGAETQRRTNSLAQLDQLFNASAGSKFFANLPATGVMHIRSLFVDHVVDCSPHDKGLRDIQPTTLMEGWIPMDWMDTYKTARKYERRTSPETFEDEALLRTLCADCVHPPDLAAPRRLSSQDALEHRQGIELLRDYPGRAVQHPTAYLDANMSLYNFFTTRDGRPGITFGDVQDGDMIAIVASLNMPLIIRGSQYASPEQIAAASDRELLDPAYRGRSLTTFTLVGSCYVHGIMDGEAVLETAQDQQCDLEDVFEDLFLI